MTLCGQTKLQFPHWMQASASQTAARLETLRFPFRGAARVSSVRGQCADGDLVAATRDHHLRHVPDEFGRAARDLIKLLRAGGRARRDFNFVKVFERFIDGFEIFLDDRATFLEIGFFDRLLDLGDRFVGRENAGKLEKAGLHDRVDPARHAGFPGDLRGVDDEQANVFV